MPREPEFVSDESGSPVPIDEYTDRLLGMSWSELVSHADTLLAQRLLDDMHLSPVDLEQVLNQHGWREIRREGSHRIYEREGVRHRVAWSSRGMGGGGLKEIARRFSLLIPGLHEGGTLPRQKRPARLPHADFNAETDALPIAIRTAREAEGLSQNDLASRLGVPLNTVKNWEIGLDSPSLKHRTGLAILFKWGDRHKVEETTTFEGPDYVSAPFVRPSGIVPTGISSLTPAQKGKLVSSYVEELVSEITRLEIRVAELEAKLVVPPARTDDEAIEELIDLDSIRKFLG